MDRVTAAVALGSNLGDRRAHLDYAVRRLRGFLNDPRVSRYYDTIPVALEESAGIDGCTRWQSFYLVVPPLAAPALVITALFSFMTVWNEYVVAALMLQDVVPGQGTAVSRLPTNPNGD